MTRPAASAVPAATSATASPSPTSRVARCATSCSAESTALTGLPFVNHHGRNWEPEPLRFAGTQLVYSLYRAADRHEARADKPGDSPLARAADLISGR